MGGMKSRLFALLLCASLLAVTQARAKTILPDACGDDKVTFEVKTEKGQPPPAPPAEGKAQIVFIETQDKTWGCLGCGTPPTRFGMDGAWVGANQGDSYFTLDVAPGEHHLCAGWQSVFGHINKMVGMASLTAEAGKVYYFEAKATLHVHSYGNNSHETDRDLEFTQLNDDEGKYRVKASKLATSTPANK
jgi:hypothetical protein